MMSDWSEDDLEMSSSSRRRRRISDSSSDSDLPQKKPNKRKKPVLESGSSEAEGSSDGSELVLENRKRRKKMPRVTSEESSEESEDDEDESEERSEDEEEEDEVVVATSNLHSRGSRLYVVSGDSSESESETDDESGFSAGDIDDSDESRFSGEEAAMLQAAIEESLADSVKICEQKKEAENKVKAAASTSAGFTSDSSDGESEKCPICLLSFTTQEVGSPETCDHTFCAVCIQEWAKNVNTCPVDRQVFTRIMIRKQFNGKVIKRISVENRDGRNLVEEPDPDPTFCEVCGECDREDRLLLCDGCDLGYHLECLDPPLENVPVEEWFCPDCSTDNSRLAEAVEIQEGELDDLLDDDVQIRPRLSRLLPRTRQSERVRASIRSIQRRLAARETALQPSTSGIESVGADSGSVTSGPRVTPTVRSTTTRRRRVVRRKTVKKRRKRRVTKRKPAKKKTKKVSKKTGFESGDGEGEEEEEEKFSRKPKRRKRRRRKIKRRKKKVSRRKTTRTAGRRPLATRSVKGRLAEQLGMCPPNRAGMSLPVVRSRGPMPDIDSQRSRAGIPTLHIFGQQNQLDYFSSDNEEGAVGEGGVEVAIRPRNLQTGSRLLARKKVLSAAALQSHTAITSPRPARQRVSSDVPTSAVSAPVDLIGSILDSQKIWHSKKSSVTIRPDGSLQVNKDLDKTGEPSTRSDACDSASSKGEDSLIRSDNKLSKLMGGTNLPLDLGGTSGKTTQAPMYPGRGGGGENRPPPSASFQFGGNRYSAPSYQSYQGGRGFSNFTPSGSSFEASSTQSGYNSYLNSGVNNSLPPPLLRNSPVRFRVTPRYPVRRGGQQRPQGSSSEDKPEDNSEGDQKAQDEEEEEPEEEDEIDIYSDIEAGGGGSGAPSGGGSEPDDGDRNVETSYQALPPPPEPSALLMGYGEQALSEEEANSDSELVIDDNGPPSPRDQGEAAPNVADSDKYDPAEPSRDSDEDDELLPPPPLPPLLAINASTGDSEIPDSDIPLPPRPPPGMPFPSTTKISPHIMKASSTSNASYLHSPTYGDSSAFESDKLSSITTEGVVNTVVKEVIKERLSAGGPSSREHSPVEKDGDDDGDECPNFSVYSAASMDIARCSDKEDVDIVNVESDNNKETEKLEEPISIKEPEDLEDKGESVDKSLNEDKEESIDKSEIDEDKEESSEKSESSESKEDSLEKPELEKGIEKLEVNEDKEEDFELSKSDTEKDDTEQSQVDKEKEGIKEVESEEKMDVDSSHCDESLKPSDQGDQVSDHSGSSSEKSEKEDVDGKVDSGEESEDEDSSDSDSSSDDDDDDSKSGSDSNDIPLPPESDKNSESLTASETPEVVESSVLSVGAEGEKADASSSTMELDKKAEDEPEERTEIPKNDTLYSDDNDSLIGGATSAISAATVDILPPSTATPLGLEGLETETISETEEAINFDDISQDEKDLVSAEEDGEIGAGKRKKKRKSRSLDPDGRDLSDLSGEINVEKEPPEEGEIVDDRPKIHETSKKEKKSAEKKEAAKEPVKITDENLDISKQKEDDKKKKKKEKRKSSEKKDERSVLSSSENKRKSKEKERTRRSEEANISWKKPSKNTKERNYRDTKTSKADDAAKDKDDKDKEEEAKDVGKKKKKEKRKDMERYDVRKIVSDKRRRRKDEFGRDLSRDRSDTRSRSRSYRRSRERSRHRSPVRARRSRSRSRRSRSRSRRSRSRSRRSRSRSRYRSRSRSYRRSRSKSKNRSKRKSRDRSRRSRSKDRMRLRLSRSRSRGRRSRTRSRSKNKGRRTRSRSPIKLRRDRNDRSHVTRGELSRLHGRRSWSRTWTPSWSRSRSRSVSCSSFSRRSSVSVRRFNRSFSRSFSRSWSRERYERVPLEKTSSMSNKAPKKLTVIVSNTKDNSQKKDKKKKKDRKNKEALGAAEKRKKRKEKSPAPSKEVFTSGDNILVSINFNKSSKQPTSKEVPAPTIAALPKDSAKRKREELFEAEREGGKKGKKEKGKDKNKGAGEKNAVGPQEVQKKKKLGPKATKSARMAALMKQKPVAIIDLDQSPFREQTPSPRDLIVLSDSEEDARNKEPTREELVNAMNVRRGLRPDSTSPQSPAKVGHNVVASIPGTRTPESELPLLSAVSNYLSTSTGPKTPPEPQQVKFSIATKPSQIRSFNNPLQEDDDMPEDAGLDDSDQRIDEELERSLGEILHKGPNTPPEPRGPTTPCSPPTSPDAYDPFDPTKSATPSPDRPEASMDGPPSPPHTPADDIQAGTVGESTGRDSTLPDDLEDLVNKTVEARTKSPSMQTSEETSEDPCKSLDRPKLGAATSPAAMSESMTSQLQNEELPQAAEISEGPKTTHGLPTTITSVTDSESSMKSPERNLRVFKTPQELKFPPISSLKQIPSSLVGSESSVKSPEKTLQVFKTPQELKVPPIQGLKRVPASQAMTSTPSHSNAPAPLFPALTPVNLANMLCTPPANLSLNSTAVFNPQPLSVPSLLHMKIQLPSEKPAAPVLPILVQNGEQAKQPLDTTTEVVDMDLDSPYSPGSSEGDDLFDPPADTPTRGPAPVHPADRSKPLPQGGKGGIKLPLPLPLQIHKSPNKTQDKFDSLFGKQGGPAAGSAAAGKGRKGHKGAKTKAKHMKGERRKEIAIKMDEDQLQILDELPSSAVELQVKDKFLKKLNRQERVVEEVKLSLKPHYNRKHITKEEYKDILRKSVPKICHNKSGEINPIKIASLVEAYVRKVRYEKKKNASASSGNNAAPPKAKVAKTTKWS